MAGSKDYVKRPSGIVRAQVILTKVHVMSEHHTVEICGLNKVEK